MTARSIRRALERKQEKLARKSARQNASATEAAAAPKIPILAETNAHKNSASLHAVRTALAGPAVLVPAANAAGYERHVAMYEEEFRPSGAQECGLVQSIAAITWRLGRIPALEMAIFAKGHLEFADLFGEHEPSLRPSLIELHTFMVYEKQLRNLQLQEARLARRREKETAELRQLQRGRQQRESCELDSPAKDHVKPSDPAAIGFEFSTSESALFLTGQNPASVWEGPASAH